MSTINIIEQLKGQIVVCESTQGALISGRLTKVEYKTTEVSGKTVLTPERLILNGDPNDYMDWALVKSMKQGT